MPSNEFAHLHGRLEISEFLGAMRRGINMVVYSSTELGDERTDTYSLLGFTAAMNRAIAECGG